MIRVLLTGATGFLGGHLLRELRKQDLRVAALCRRPEAADALRAAGAEPVSGDVRDAASLAAALREPTAAVFHAAADTSVWRREAVEQTRTNIDGTRNVIAAVREAGVARLVHTSSIAVFGKVEDRPLVETLPRAGIDSWINYERSKAAAENLVRDAVARGEIDAVICNPAHVFGPGDRRNWARLILLLDRGRLPGTPPGAGAFADVREVARGHVAAWKHGRNGEGYLLGGENTSFADLLRRLAVAIGCMPPRRTVPARMLHIYAALLELVAAFTRRMPELTREGAALTSQRLRVDSAKAEAELDYRITPLDRLVHDTVDWLRTEGMLLPR